MPGVVQESPFKTFTVREIHPTFGAEVEGVDFQNLTDESFQEIIAAMAKVTNIPSLDIQLLKDSAISAPDI